MNNNRIGGFDLSKQSLNFLQKLWKCEIMKMNKVAIWIFSDQINQKTE